VSVDIYEHEFRIAPDPGAAEVSVKQPERTELLKNLGVVVKR
jgi:hypothetical protein